MHHMWNTCGSPSTTQQVSMEALVWISWEEPSKRCLYMLDFLVLFGPVHLLNFRLKLTDAHVGDVVVVGTCLSMFESLPAEARRR